MSYSDPAPFKRLKSMAQGIIDSLEALEKHPEAAKAFEALVDDTDFDDIYGGRYKDMPSDVPELLVALEATFGIDEKGQLYVESGYSTFFWIDGEWVNEDEAEEDEEDDEEEEDEEEEEKYDEE